ncbi:MAG: 4Fe-4S dicluster domain-containing protein [Nitrososphaerota archaeon]|nr:4Fe-4S dicluster domain-containing protein [Nitrososphaerota archaeon]MDG7023813.1 4Fe-4S dicluster domain-containing protein [Nitrososphaerota archaeon]
MAQAQALRSDPTLVKRLKKFGAFEVDACFDCGNCTALCPLSVGKTAFPRRMITYAQQGLEGKLLGTPDMWLCDYCGECTKTCPRQAEPSEFMMAARRFAVSKYTPTKISELMFTSRAFVLLFMAVAALLPIGIFAALPIPTGTGATNMFSFVPEGWIHYAGIAVGAAIGLAALAGVVRMYRRVSEGLEGDGQKAPPLGTWLRQLVPTVFKESLLQSRSEECPSEKTTKDRVTGRWITHMMIFWGFVGLLLSTTLRYIVVPTNGAVVPLYEPVRLLGTVSGVLLTYGTLAMMVKRLRKSEISTRRTQFTDWVFLALLFLTGLSGFVLEASSYGTSGTLIDYALAAHLIAVFELLVMAPFTKFAHVIYRPVAIWMSRAYGRI